MKYLPLQNTDKPFLYNKKWYNRNELIKMNLDKEAHDAILAYTK